MQQIWYLFPAGPLADAIAPHLDRAGVSFIVAGNQESVPNNSRQVFLCGKEQDAEIIARRIIEADGKEFVPITDGECLNEAIRLNLFPKGTDWQAPLTREEAAVLAIRLITLIRNL